MTLWLLLSGCNKLQSEVSETFYQVSNNDASRWNVSLMCVHIQVARYLRKHFQLHDIPERVPLLHGPSGNFFPNTDSRQPNGTTIHSS